MIRQVTLSMASPDQNPELYGKNQHRDRLFFGGPPPPEPVPEVGRVDAAWEED
jgi:hypothetical protein